MKDASAFNVLFDGCRPTFIDHGSFRETYSGHWPGYSQFGDHFMNPLIIEANAGVAAAGAGLGVDGISLGVAAASSRGLRRFKKGRVRVDLAPGSGRAGLGSGNSGHQRKAVRGQSAAQRCRTHAGQGGIARAIAEQRGAEYLAGLRSFSLSL